MSRLSTQTQHCALVALALGGTASLEGCGDSNQTPEPARVADDARAREPSCDVDRIEAIAATLDANRNAWTPGRGLIPDFAGYVASGLWTACDLPPAARAVLAASVTPPRAPWEERGLPQPPGAPEPIETAMPGFGEVVADPSTAPLLASMLDTVCPGHDALVLKVANQPSEDSPAAIFDGCGFTNEVLTREEFIEHGILMEGAHFLALHRWLVRAEVAPATARTLVRTLALEGAPTLSPGVRFRPPLALRLPPLTRGFAPRPSQVLYVGPDAIHSDEARVRTLPQDATPRSFIQAEGLQDVVDVLEQGWKTLSVADGGVSFAFHRTIRWDVAALCIAAAGQAHAQRVDVLGLSAQSHRGLRRVAIVDPFDGPAAFTLRIDATEAKVSCGDIDSSVPYAEVASAVETCGVSDAAPVALEISGVPKLTDVLTALDGLGARPREIRTPTGR